MMAMVVIPVLICGMILLTRRVERQAARPLGAALLITALSMCPQIIGFAGGYAIWPWLTYFPLFFMDLWLGPLMMVHAHRLMSSDPLGWKAWLFLPGAVQFLYNLIAFTSLGDGPLDHEAKFAFTRAVHLPYIVPVESVLGMALIGLAIIVIWRQRSRYLIFLEQTQSAARDYDPVWIRNFIIALAICGALWIGQESAHLIFAMSYGTAFPYLVLIMCVIAWLAMDAAWRLTDAFPKMSGIVMTPAAPALDRNLFGRIDQAVSDGNWYLEPRLSVRDIAKRLGSNESYVSRAINQTTGMSFNNWVNRARVERAKTLLIDAPSMSILAIAMESGFNSKATFNRVFRDIAGRTPSQFRHRSSPGDTPVRRVSSQNP